MYKLINYRGWEGIFRLSDSTTIPINPANTDYQQYLLWLEQGNVPLPPDEVTK